MRSSPFRKRLLLGSVLTSMIMVASLLGPITPTQAYSPNPTVYWIGQNATYCYKIGGEYPGTLFSWGSTGAGCYIAGSLHGFYFAIDKGGYNDYFELWAQGHLVGQIAFQAYDELLYIADTRNDSDTFYVWINNSGPYRAPGSSAIEDRAEYDLSLPDGVVHSIKITDDSAGNDVIGSSSTNLPYLVP